ncbi:MAG: glycosyltransferase family 4 protein [Bacteroidales bacterium]|nr:glycosyltransferase family 4 protein [Bacteroidales bacterium]
MRILIIANKVPYPPKDGGSIATLTLARHFSYLGHQVTVLAMNTSKHYFPLDQLPLKLSNHIKFIGVDTEAPISPIAALKNLFFSRKAYIAERFYTEKFRIKLEELLDENDYDIIQLEGSYMGMYMPSIRLHSSAKVAMRAHNLEYEIWERTAKNAMLLKRFYFANLAQRIKNLEVSLLNSFHAMIPITQRDADSLRVLGCKIPMHITPTGIDVEDSIKSDADIEFPSVFHIGALDWPPNQEGLLWFFEKVWPLVIEKHPQLKFYLAGRNASAKIKSLEATNLIFLGEVESATDFMNTKAIGVVPLLSGSGMRIKIVEGMALGKSMITTKIGVEGIPATDGKDIMIADKPEEFAEKICRMLDDKVLFEKIGNEAYAFVHESFDNRVIAKSLLDFYKTL